MSFLQKPFDWDSLGRRGPTQQTVADPRRRIRLLGLIFFALGGLVFARVVQLEWSEGEAFRAAPPSTQTVIETTVPRRGRIVSRDGTVLAEDRTLLAVAIDYRLIQAEPPGRWLRSLARKRIAQQPSESRRSLEDEIAALRQEHQTLHARLAELCQVTPDEWMRHRARVETKIAALAAHVNQRREEAFARRTAADPPPASDGSWGDLVLEAGRQLFAPPAPLPPPKITVAEQLEHHIVYEGISPAAAARIRNHPEAFPGVRLEEVVRRQYPHATLAANLLGHLGRDEQREQAADDVVFLTGKLGLELSEQAALAGQSGRDQVTRNKQGRERERQVLDPPIAGDDLVLSIDASLQQVAEALLDEAIARRGLGDDSGPKEAGGAAIVIDINTGSLLACASAPRFDPAVFVADDTQAAAHVLTDLRRPLFDRAMRMALPPGSTFKAVTAVALLEGGKLDPAAALPCRGYWQAPDRHRCMIYRRYGVGHGPMDLYSALAQSCNVYFFHHSEHLGPERLVSWAARFGLGQKTGVDLPFEARGNLPSPRASEQQGDWWTSDHTAAMSVGQGELTATPLQMVRAMAAIANGGRLVTPRVVLPNRSRDRHASQGRSIPGLSAASLRATRAGLRRAVVDELGTAHRTAGDSPVAMAGKTGTAEAGGETADHAWFVGYAPADRPQVAFVVALEHGGSGGDLPVRIARVLVEQLHARGQLSPHVAAQRGPRE